MAYSKRFRLNHQQTAALLGMSESSLWRAQQDRGAPKGQRAGRVVFYDARKVVRWRLADIQSRELDLSRERARLAAAQATVTEIGLADLQRSRVSAEVVAVNWSAFRAVSTEIVRRIGPRVTAHLVDRGLVVDEAPALAVIGAFIAEAIAELHPESLPPEVRVRLSRSEPQ